MEKCGCNGLNKIEHRIEAIEALKEYPGNPRRITSQNLERLKASILEFGMVDPIIVDEDLLILGGHQRKKAAEAAGLVSVPVMIVHGLTDEKKRKLVVALNHRGMQGEFDLSATVEILKGLKLSVDGMGLDLLRARCQMKLESLAQEGQDYSGVITKKWILALVKDPDIIRRIAEILTEGKCEWQTTDQRTATRK